jgi:2-methylcitrate dehydratase PrpD
VLEGRYGYFTAFSEPTDLALLVNGLGQDWAIRPPSHKSFATHVTHQAVVQAILEWKQQHAIAAQNISRVIIRGTPRITEARHAQPDPQTVMGGQYSLPFTAAVACARDLSNPLVYTEDAVHDPVIRALAQRIELIADDNLVHTAADRLQAIIVIECADHTYTLHTRPHQGSPRRPFTWADISEKFRRYTAHCLSDTRATAIIEAVSALEATTNMRDVAEMLAQHN